MDWNALAQWIGESGSGSWSQFKETFRWLSADDQPPGGVPAHRAALQLSGLGYMEMDWQEGRWAAAPPCLTLVPDAGGAGLLVGGRTRHLMARIEAETAESATLHVLGHRHAQAQAPDAFYFTADLGELEALAARIGIQFEHSIANRMNRLLPKLSTTLALGRTEAPPPQGFEISQWQAPGWNSVTSTDRPGLYKGGAFGRPRYWFILDDARTSNVDGPTGFYAELSRTRRPVLRYKKETVNGTLFRPLWAPFPLLQERTAVLSSGLAPYCPNNDAPHVHRRIRYENVPRRIAEGIASSLETALDIIR